MKIVREVNGIAIAYVENAMGRTLQIGTPKTRAGAFGGTERDVFATNASVVARDKGELRALIRALRSFEDDMPDSAPGLDEEIRAAARGEVP